MICSGLSISYRFKEQNNHNNNISKLKETGSTIQESISALSHCLSPCFLPEQTWRSRGNLPRDYTPAVQRFISLFFPPFHPPSNTRLRIYRDIGCKLPSGTLLAHLARMIIPRKKRAEEAASCLCGTHARIIRPLRCRWAVVVPPRFKERLRLCLLGER